MKSHTKSISSLLLTICSMQLLCFSGISAHESQHQACLTNTGVRGVCVRLQNCDSIRNYLASDPFMGISQVFNSICSVGFFKITVCCPQVEADVSSYKPLKPPHCGFSNATHNRVVGGDPAELDAWPWMAAVGIRFGEEPDAKVFSCGGALISSRHVVTAAHCMVFEGVTYLVRLGALNLEGEHDDGANPIEVAVEEYTLHPNYNDTSKENDVAILRLERDIESTRSIHPICLPVEERLRNRDFVGNYPFVIGWGATSYNGSNADILQEVQVPVITNTQCKESYKKKKVVIDDRVLCAGFPGGGKDACQGDSGGPLMFPEKRNYYLIGVVSSGFKCATAGYPGVYTRVTYFLDFILSNMK